jgi:hypothetical protein
LALPPAEGKERVVPRKGAGGPRNQQLLIRLTADELEVLESAAHLNRLTPASYSYALIQHHIASLRSDHFIARDMQNRQAFSDSLASTIVLASRPQEPAAIDRHLWKS